MDPDFKKKVGDSWTPEIAGTKMYQLVGKLNRLNKVLKQLNKTKFSDIEIKAGQAKEELLECQKQIQLDPLNTGLIGREHDLANKYSRLKKASDQFLRQKSKIQWLKQGDQNNRYFHSYMKARRNANRIFSIKDSTGRMVKNMEGIAKAFVDFYKAIRNHQN